MFRKFMLAAIIALLASTFAFGSVQPTKAAFSNLNVSVECSSISFSGTTDAPGYLRKQRVIHLVVTNITKSITLVDEYPSASGSGPTYTFGGTLIFASTASPDDQLAYGLTDSNSNPGFFIKCKGTPIPEAPGPVVPIPVVAGPSAPAGFVQKTRLCNTPVYSQVDGDPVSGTAIKVGQVWSVNPVAVVGKQRSWTEIFAGSYSNGFVPTACVK